MASTWGDRLRLSIFGESHGPGIGVVLDGLPAGEAVDFARVAAQMARRAPGRDPTATKRREDDAPEVLSGLLDGRTTGAPLAALIRNSDTRSSDYADLRRLPRPSHADYPASLRYGGFHDVRGGGHFSGRLTAPLVFAGAVCRQILRRRGVTVGGHIASIAGVRDELFDPVTVTDSQLLELSARSFALVDSGREAPMRAAIEEARLAGDSVGGVVECAAVGLPGGLGSPMFDGVENQIASIVFGIPAVRGVEFGAGFAAAAMRGGTHNDAFVMRDGRVETATNHHGGVLGGITTGMPLIFRVAIKPTPSIAQEQRTVDLKTGESATLTVKGRHDPCIVPRALPAVEAAAAVALLNLML